MSLRAIDLAARSEECSAMLKEARRLAKEKINPAHGLEDFVRGISGPCRSACHIQLNPGVTRAAICRSGTAPDGTGLDALSMDRPLSMRNGMRTESKMHNVKYVTDAREKGGPQRDH